MTTRSLSRLYSPRWAAALSSTACAALLSLGAASVQAQSAPAAPPAPAASAAHPGHERMHEAKHERGMPWSQRDHRGGPGMMGLGFFNPRMAQAVGVSDAQREQIRAIFKKAAQELKDQRFSHGAEREQMLALLAAPKIDAQALEALRQKQVAQHEAASKRWLQASIDAAQVLSPEQRSKLASLIQERQGRKEARQKPAPQPAR